MMVENPSSPDAQPKRIARLVSLGVILGLVAVTGLLSLRVMSSFLLPLLLAAMLVVIFGPLHRWLRERLTCPDWVAAMITTLFVLVIVLVPLFLLVARAGGDAVAMLRTPNGLKLDPAVLDGLVGKVNDATGMHLTAESVNGEVLLAAIVQAVLAGFGFYVAGLGNVFLLTLLTFFGALVPFVGAAAVWGGASLYLLFFLKNTWAAAGLALWGLCVVSTVDNIIKPIVLHGQSKLHPLLALLSVLGGVGALGPIGIFVGPIAVAFLQAALTMLQAELDSMGQGAADGKGLPSPAGIASSGGQKPGQLHERSSRG